MFEWGGNEEIVVFPIKSITASSSYVGFNIESAVDLDIDTRWSSAENTLSYIELTMKTSVCANAVYTLFRESGEIPHNFNVKISGFDTSWHEIDTISYATSDFRNNVTKRFNNSNNYSKYRFEFLDYSHDDGMGSNYCGMTCMAFMNIS